MEAKIALPPVLHSCAERIGEEQEPRYVCGAHPARLTELRLGQDATKLLQIFLTDGLTQ